MSRTYKSYDTVLHTILLLPIGTVQYDVRTVHHGGVWLDVAEIMDDDCLPLPAIDGVTPESLPDKDKVYFNDYSTLVQQQGMLQDTVRTSLYQFAILENKADFAGKTVLDVGAGTGILSFFAVQAGAKQVYAVEASGMARKAEKLSQGNGLSHLVTVVNKRVEDMVRVHQ